MNVQAPETFKTGTLVIDRAVIFDPIKHIANGLFMEVDKSERFAKPDFDFSELSSLGAGSHRSISDDVKVGMAFFSEKGQKTLRWLYKTAGVTHIEFRGSTITNVIGYKYYAHLYRLPEGRWAWYCSLQNRALATETPALDTVH